MGRVTDAAITQRSAVQDAIVDAVEAPLTPPMAHLREGVFGTAARALFGLVQFRNERFRLGPLTLLSFGEPRAEHDAWVWPITGGLLARRPGGTVRIAWTGGRLLCEVAGYQPLVPEPLYRWTQLPFHHEITHIGLLRLRGRTPTAGMPAEPWRRLLAAALDVAAAASLGVSVRPAHPVTRATLFGLGLVAGQLVVPALTGSTPGGSLVGVRIVGADGSPARPAQLLLRLLAMPGSVRGLRDRHDELAGTEIVLIG